MYLLLLQCTMLIKCTYVYVCMHMCMYAFMYMCMYVPTCMCMHVSFVVVVYICTVNMLYMRTKKGNLLCYALIKVRMSPWPPHTDGEHMSALITVLHF